MNENKHTPEPWHVSDDERGECIVFADRHTVAGTPCENFIDCNTSANARRIVACVNRLAQFTTEQIEDFGYDLFAEDRPRLVEAQNEIHLLKKQRDELLAELQRFMDSHEECTDFDGFTAQIVSMDDYHQAQEAIARAKGEQ